MAEEIVRVSISMNRELKDTAKELAKLRGLDMSSLVRTLLLREIELENSKKK
jgi:antitoxin component of RelBE/YafQ-DinJ toxin-antitoxin module